MPLHGTGPGLEVFACPWGDCGQDTLHQPYNPSISEDFPKSPHDFCGVFNQLANHANPQGQPKEKQRGQDLNKPEIHIVPNKHLFSP